MRVIAILAVAVALTGCSLTPQEGKPTPAALVYATKNSYEAALIVAVRYNELPRCGAPTSPPLCSDAGAVTLIRKSNDAARITLDAAEATARDPKITEGTKEASVTAAVNAVAALQAILALYSPKGK